MIALIVGTHGKFSFELVRSAEMISGQQENLGVAAFEPGESMEDLAEKYEELMENLDCKDGVLFLVDLFGGSPFNVASRIAINHQSMDIISGVNLPMLLEIFGNRQDSSLFELVQMAKRAGSRSIKAFKENSVNNVEEEEL